jgi:hypothetical protein
MFVQLLALTLAPAGMVATSNSPQAAVVSLEDPKTTGIDVRPRIVALRADRIVAAPNAPEAKIDEFAVRVSSPAGLLWQGNLRVAQNQGASYSQNFSQASPTLCPPNVPYDRSERSSINFNVYVQNSGEYGPIYRIDASLQRPIDEAGCGERGTRTVQVNKTLALDPGESGVVEGDAGLRVEVTRRR